jgi:hypothetical protein
LSTPTLIPERFASSWYIEKTDIFTKEGVETQSLLSRDTDAMMIALASQSGISLGLADKFIKLAEQYDRIRLSDNSFAIAPVVELRRLRKQIKDEDFLSVKEHLEAHSYIASTQVDRSLAEYFKLILRAELFLKRNKTKTKKVTMLPASNLKLQLKL